VEEVISATHVTDADIGKITLSELAIIYEEYILQLIVGAQTQNYHQKQADLTPPPRPQAP
jgi:hypothetical protein